MPDVYTDAGVVYADLLAAAYDKDLKWTLRSRPIFRQFCDVHPVAPTHNGPSVTLTIMKDFAALATTPLTETSDVTAVAPGAPSQVTVSLNEYGNVDIPTLKLRSLAFTPPDPAIVRALGNNMFDTVDKLVQNVLDTGTHVIGNNGGTMKTEGSAIPFAEGSVAGTDVLDSEVIRDAVTLLRRRIAPGFDSGENYVAVAHPDVLVDVLSDTGWLSPHQYVDTRNIYNAEVGTYLGARFISSPRTTVETVGAVDVYNTYFLGREALVEAIKVEPHVVIGPQVDRLRRFFPIGWYGLGGWAMFRQESVQIARTASSVQDL